MTPGPRVRSTDDAPKPATRRILGIDPGLRVTGFGILDASGGKLVYVTSGCIRATGTSLPIRLGVIVRDLAHVIAEERPTEVAVEKVFVNVNPQFDTVAGPGARRGDLRRGAGGLPVTEYTALQVKQAVVGMGRAQKDAGAGNGQAPAAAARERRQPMPPTRSRARSATPMDGRAWARSRTRRVSGARRAPAVAVEFGSMIGRLSGTLLEKNPPQMLVDVHGVAYEVDVPMSTYYNLPATGERSHAATPTWSCARTRTCSYGFGTEDERQGISPADQGDGHRGARSRCRCCRGFRSPSLLRR